MKIGMQIEIRQKSNNVNTINHSLNNPTIFNKGFVQPKNKVSIINHNPIINTGVVQPKNIFKGFSIIERIHNIKPGCGACGR